MIYKRSAAVVIAVVWVLTVVDLSRGLLNPNFTPVHLAEDSSGIFELHFDGAKDGKATASVKRVLKGKMDDKTIAFTLSTSALAEQVKSMEQELNVAGGVSAALFVGNLGVDASQGGQGGQGGDAPPGGGNKAFLHLGTEWITFNKGKSGTWEMDSKNGQLPATWNGGTEMLLRAVDYVLADPDHADVPAVEGVKWSSQKKFGAVEGKVTAALPVDLVGDGHNSVYIISDKGDKLFKYDAESGNLVDATAATKLAVKSQLAAWVDLNGDGRMDLVSYDGTALRSYHQGADGTFGAGDLEKMAGAIVSLSAINGGKAGEGGIVIGTTKSPVLSGPGKEALSLPHAAADLGDGGVCVAADFDNDGNVDIIQLFEKGSWFYRGKGAGLFEDGQRTDPSLGKGQPGAFTGDFDGDGKLDLFSVSADDTTRLWRNLGSDKGVVHFADTLSLTGEISYKGKTGATGGMAGDINNDGRQDVFFYYPVIGPQLYFNRGFQSFGFCNGLDPIVNGILVDAADGVQAGALVDVAGDGGQSMIIVLKNGDAWTFNTDGSANPCLKVALSSKGSDYGPLSVTAWRGSRPLGAWNVVAGTGEAQIGITPSGPVTLKWKTPDGKEQSKEVVVENKPVRFVIGK